MALTRRPTASVEIARPDDEVFAWPHLLFRELLVALGRRHRAARRSRSSSWRRSRRSRTRRARRTRRRRRGTSSACRSSSTTGRSSAASRADAARPRAARRCRTSTGTRRVGPWFAPERRVANTLFTAGGRRAGRADDRRHVLPRPELGLGVAVVMLRQEPGAMREPQRAPPGLLVAFAVLGLAFLAIFSWVLSRRAGRRVARHAGAVPAARGGGQEPAPARRSRRASAACGRSGCPTSDRVDRCTTCHLGIDDPAFAERAAALPDASRARG